MLQFLLDEHISPAVAGALRRHYRGLAVVCMAEWEKGEFLGQPDSVCLQQAALKRLTLVTYDRRTIPLLLKTWAEEGRSHGGVIFVDEKTIPPCDVGSLVRTLGNLWRQTMKWNWAERCLLLGGIKAAATSHFLMTK